jgi:hypothetical protein
MKDINVKQVMLRGSRRGRKMKSVKEGEYGWGTFYTFMNMKY